MVDSIEGVTHALRTTEYAGRNEHYAWFQDTLDLRHVQLWDFARISFIRTFLSKRKLKQVVDTRVVDSWNDPRMPTVRGILRRGSTVAALRQFRLKQGQNRNVVSMDWTILWAMNLKVIDPAAARHTAVETKNMVRAKIINGPGESYFATQPRHPKQSSMGTKDVLYSSDILLKQADAATFLLGEAITLMKWGNAMVKRIDRTDDTVVGMELVLNLEGDFRKTDKKVTWLATDASKSSLVPAELWEFDYLLTKEMLTKKDTSELEEYLTPKSALCTNAVCEANVRQCCSATAQGIFPR